MSEKKILVIDDDPDILDSISAVLSSVGYEIITAVDGNDGFDKFRSYKPDLVLCDMMMERVDAGNRVAEMIKDENHGAPVYLMSSIGNVTASNINISELGFTGVMQKPIDPETLITQVKKALEA